MVNTAMITTALRRILVLTLLFSASFSAQATQDLPFKVETVTAFDEPWAMVFLPDGQVVTVDEALKLSGIRELIPFTGSIALDERVSLSLFDIPLDEGIQSGTYRIVVLVAAAGTNPAEEENWLGFDEATFTFSK